MSDKNSVIMFGNARNVSKLASVWKNWSNKKNDMS
jgi:hypothetical protein